MPPTRGVWSFGRRVLSFEMEGMGRMVIRRMGRREMKAKIWWGVEKVLDCGFVRVAE